jgi:MFS family permease
MAERKILNPTVLKLSFVSFFADVSSEMLYPVTPIFLTATLGASMASVGLVEGFAEAVASLLKMSSGVWSDRSGRRKPFVLGGYLLAALAKPLTAFAGSWPEVLLIRGLDRTGKGLRSAPRDALLAEAVHESSHGAAFGWHRAFDSAGAALGPLLALVYLRSHSDNLRPLYLWALIPGLLSVAFVLAVKEKRVPASDRRIPFLSWSAMNPEFRRYLCAWGLFSLSNSSDAFLLMRARGLGFELADVVLVYCFYNLAYSLLSPYLGSLSDRIGRGRVLVGGLALFAAVYSGFAFASAHWHLWALFGLYGIYMAATDGVGKAYAVQLVPKNQKATAVGTLGAVTGVAALFASTLAGLLWDHVGAAAPFLFGAGGAVAAAAFLALEPKPETNPA